MKIAIATTAPPEDPPNGEILAADGIEVTRNGRSVLNGVSVRVGCGEVVGLLGPNGSGKTTLLGIIGGWIRSDLGAVRVAGQDVSMLDAKRRWAHGLAVCPSPKPFWVRRKSMVEQFSAAISREPNVVCLDEPFNGIAPMSLAHAAIAAMIESLTREGCGILIADHNVRESLGYVDRAYLIYDGSILREGSKEFLINGTDNNGEDPIR